MPIIIGNGSVGRAMEKAIKIKLLGKSERKVETDVVFICVPTPTVNNKQDISEVLQAFNRIKKAQLIVLRSTILPGTTDKLQEKSKIPIMFVPEFGKEKTMEHDIAHPEIYILGMTEKSIPVEDLALDIMPKADKFIRVKAISAEFTKYFSNLWKANQISFANSLYDWVIQQTNNELVYNQAIDAILNLKDLPKWGWRIFDKGYRGYSGKCLPKDIKAATSQFSNGLWIEFDKYNEKLVSSNGQISKER